MPMQAALRVKRASPVQDEHVAAPGFVSRVMARHAVIRAARAFTSVRERYATERARLIASPGWPRCASTSSSACPLA